MIKQLVYVEPSSGRRENAACGVGRSPRHFGIVLVIKRELYVRTRILLPARTLATFLPEGGL